jgi:hypothetical protein
MRGWTRSSKRSWWRCSSSSRRRASTKGSSSPPARTTPGWPTRGLPPPPPRGQRLGCAWGGSTWLTESCLRAVKPFIPLRFILNLHLTVGGVCGVGQGTGVRRSLKGTGAAAASETLPTQGVGKACRAGNVYTDKQFKENWDALG